MAKSEHTPSRKAIAPGETIELHTRFGDLSRGKCWGKYYAGKERPTGDFVWCEKSGGTLYLSGPGYYVVGSSDGFSREARGEFRLAAAPAAGAKSHEVAVAAQAVGLDADTPAGVVADRVQEVAGERAAAIVRARDLMTEHGISAKEIDAPAG